jgi:hypothetical protein
MKHLFLLAVIIAACTLSAFAQPKQMIYTAAYSSDFKMGDAKLATKVLELWKDWDENAFNRHDYFADSIVMFFPDGGMVQGKKAALDSAKKYRDMVSKVVSTVHAWMPIYSNDRKENTVLIWGSEENTAPDGKVTYRDIHEVWWFNKDGKATAMRQWTANFKDTPPAK